MMAGAGVPQESRLKLVLISLCGWRNWFEKHDINPEAGLLLKAIDLKTV